MDDNGIPDGWHRFPKDDAWKKCTLRGLVENGERLWLYCAGCRRTRYLETVQWAETHGVNLDWPLLTLARRMRCSRCNRKAASLRAQPYRNQPERDETVPDGIEECPCAVHERWRNRGRSCVRSTGSACATSSCSDL
jgi:hypothetical protein